MQIYLLNHMIFSNVNINEICDFSKNKILKIIQTKIYFEISITCLLENGNLSLAYELKFN